MPQGKSASANQKHYPDLGSDTTDTSMKFLPRLFLTDVISQGITKCYDCFLRRYKLKLLLSCFNVVGLVNQPCLSVLLFLKFILQIKTASKWVPWTAAQLYLVVTEKDNGLFGRTGHDGNYFNRKHGRKGSSWGQG